MKLLTPSAVAHLAARHARPVILVTLTSRDPVTGAFTYRWASQADGDGSGGYRTGGSGTLYSADIVDIPRIVREIPRRYGVMTQPRLELLLANPDRAGYLWAALLDEIDRAECSLDLILADGAESPEDAIRLYSGAVPGIGIGARMVSLRLDDGVTGLRPVPFNRTMTAAAYPHAPVENRGRVRPVLFGDLTRRAFDFDTPSSGVFPHVPIPTINVRRQQAELFDGATGGGRETLMLLSGQLVEVPDAAVDISTNRLDVVSNAFHLWLEPRRIDPVTSGTIISAEHACTPNLDEAAHIGPGTGLFLDMSGAPGGIGGIGHGASLVAADVAIYTVYSKAEPLDTDPARLTVRLDGAGISGHTALSLNDAGIAVDTQEIGDHVASWEDLSRLSLVVYGEPGTSGVYVHRVAMRVRFRSSGVHAAFSEQRLYRSQCGFTEDAASPLADYVDGMYVRGARTAEPLDHPADIAEAVLRGREWGLGLTAISLQDTGAVLSGVVYPSMTAIEVSTAASIGIGHRLLVDSEVMQVTGIDGTTLSVLRSVHGSSATCHHPGASVWRFGESGEVDSAGFRAAAGVLREPDGVERVANGGMEGAYTGGVASGWSEYDPSAVGTPAPCDGYTGRYGQQITRTASGGLHPGVAQAIGGLTAGAWYRVALYARCASGASTVQCSLAQSLALHPNFSVGTEWRRITFDAQAADSSFTLRLRNAGAEGDAVQFDGVSVQALTPWKMGFALTREHDAEHWLDRAFLPQCGMRMYRDAHGRLTVSAMSHGRPPVERIDASCIAVNREGTPLVEAFRSPASEVTTGVAVRYGRSYVTGGYDGRVTLGAASEHTGQRILSLTSGDPLDTISVADSSGLAPRDSAEETTDIIASGTTVTLPSGDLLSTGVEAGDWFMVRVPYGTFLHRIASVTGASQVVVADYPPQYGEPGLWSVAAKLFTAGGEIFGVFDTPDAASARVFRGFDSHSFHGGGMSEGDAIHAVDAYSADGTGLNDETGVLRNNRERVALDRLARHGGGRTIIFDAPYIRDRRTACFLRNRLFDDANRAWIVYVTTDLSTLALDPGDAVTVEHELIPGGMLTGEIERQAVDPLRGLIEYRVRSFSDRT